MSNRSILEGGQKVDVDSLLDWEKSEPILYKLFFALKMVKSQEKPPPLGIQTQIIPLLCYFLHPRKVDKKGRLIFKNFHDIGLSIKM